MSRQDNSFFIAFLTSLVVSIGTSVVMYLVVLPRMAPSPQRQMEPKVSVPPLSGIPMSQARSLLSSLGLQMVLADQQSHPTHTAGKVLSHLPAPGSLLNKGQIVKVIISLGSKRVAPAPRKAAETQTHIKSPPPRSRKVQATTVRVPRLTRMNVGAARRLIRKAGLRVGSISYSDDEDLPPRWVLRQIPRRGKRVQRGTRIRLVINQE